MAIFGRENDAKRFLFRNLHEKLGIKLLWKIISKLFLLFLKFYTQNLKAIQGEINR